MNILHTVESYYPEVGGMPETVRQISEELVNLGHKVTVATRKSQDRKKKIINGVKIIEFGVSGKAVFGMHGKIDKYRSFLLNSNFDIVTNFAAQQWATDIALPILSQIKAKKVFVPTGFSRFYSPFYRNYYRKMEKWMKEYDMNVFLSSSYRDINFARKNNIQKIMIIPNGASQKEFLRKTTIDIRKKFAIPSYHFLILVVSSHLKSKDHSATIDIFEKAKIKNATLLIIGNNPEFLRGCYPKCRLRELKDRVSFSFRKDGKRVLIRNLGRRETVAVFKAADLFLFTSKIECSPIVLFESVASKTPFLTTDVGNSKEIIQWTKGGKLLPTYINKLGYSKAVINISARMLENCYRNRSKLLAMGELGYKTWLKKYTWEKIAKKYESLYDTLIHS